MRAFLMQAIWLSHSNYTFRLPECEAPKRDHPAGYRVHQVQVSPIAATGQLHESRHKVTEAWTFLAKIAAGKGPMNYRTARATECTFGKTSSKKKRLRNTKKMVPQKKGIENRSVAGAQRKTFGQKTKSKASKR